MTRVHLLREALDATRALLTRLETFAAIFQTNNIICIGLTEISHLHLRKNLRINQSFMNEKFFYQRFLLTSSFFVLFPSFSTLSHWRFMSLTKYFFIHNIDSQTNKCDKKEISKKIFTMPFFVTAV